VTLPSKDTSSTNEIQMLSFVNDTLFLNNGGFVYLGNYDNLIAISQLFQKVIADSTYLKQLIDINSISITDLHQILNNIEAKHIADSTALANDIKDVSGNLTIETTNRIAEDNALLSKIISDSSAIATDINNVSNDLASETTNRIASDNTIIAKHTSDSTLMANNLIALNAGLNTETSNRIAADINLSNKDIADSTYLRGLINTNINDISTETTNRIASDNSIESKATTDSTFFKGLNDNLNTAISTETSNRITADNTLSNKEIADSAYLGSLINTNANNLNTHISTDTDIDSTNEIQTLSRAGLNISLSKTFGNISVADNDNDSLNELQVFTINGDTLFLSKGNFLKLPYEASDGLVLDQTTFKALNDSNLWNANKLHGKTISTDPPDAGQFLKWDGTVWKPVSDPAGVGKGSNATTLIYLGSGF
jgi:hypothetical protein